MNPEQIQQAQALAKEWKATCKQQEQPALDMVNPAPASYLRALMRQTIILKLLGTNFWQSVPRIIKVPHQALLALLLISSSRSAMTRTVL